MPGKGAGRPIRNELVVWGGQRYTWSKGFWRATSYYDRHNLTHRIWLEATGNPVPKGYQIIFVDGDYHNLSPINLLCVTPRQAGLIRTADDERKAINSAYLAYGHLVNAMSETNNPALSRARALKAWQTRKERYGKQGQKTPIVRRVYDPVVAKAAAQKANQTKRERYGDKDPSWETRRRRMGLLEGNS